MSENQRFIDEVLESPHLPSLPAVALEVISLSERPDLDVELLARVLKQDPALASKILKTVNSSFYGQARTIATVNQAIVILGMNTVLALALGFSLVDSLDRNPSSDFDYDEFWRRSLRVAAAARVLAGWTPSIGAEEAYLGGLLSRLGVLALSSVLGAGYQEVFKSSDGGYRGLLQAERAVLGVDHATVGQRLADKWNLPRSVSDTIGYLAAPDDAPEAQREMVRVIATADSVAELFGDAPATALERYRRQCDEWFGVIEPEVDLAVGLAEEAFSSMSGLLEIPADEIPTAAVILSRANEALTRISLQVAQESVRLATENSELAHASMTDPLTGLANRRHFDQFLEEQSRIARRYAGSVGLLMIDLDYFKRVNDSYGHRVGDLALQAVATALRELLRESDLVSRIGGEEFAVVMPSTDLDRSCTVAERARIVIRDVEVLSADGISLSVTASIGVTVLNGRLLDGPSEVLERADAALYVAKQGGRDRIATLPIDEAA